MSVLRWDNEAGQAVIAAAANLWSGSSIPDWRDNEYARPGGDDRGQCAAVHR
jgi:hypothetical protein